MTTMSLFERAGVAVTEPEPMTEVRLGHRSARVRLARKRREALEKLIPILDQLEGKDIYISWCGGARSHFWLTNLKLSRLQVEKGWSAHGGGTSVIVLWGSRGANVRIFTDRLYAVREQEYSGYTLWLVDFWNGFGGNPIDDYSPYGYEALEIKRMKD